MKDNRLRAGMRLLRNNQEFIIEKPLNEDEIQIRNVKTNEFFPIKKKLIVDEIFEGLVEIIGDFGQAYELEKKVKKLKISDITVLDESSPWRIETCRRYEYVQRFDRTQPRKITKESLLPVILKVSAELDDLKPPSWQTLKRWYSQFIKAGKDPRVLIPAHQLKGNRNSKFTGKVLETITADDLSKAAEVDAIVDKVIRNKYLIYPAPSVQSVLEWVNITISDENRNRSKDELLPEPHINSIFKRIGKLDKYEVDAAKFGKEYADKKYRQHQQGPRPTRPLERVELDHTKLDLMIIDTETGLPLGRPYITALIDVFTKNVLGFYVSFYPPGYLTVMKCLLHAIKPKNYLKNDYPEVKNEWLCYGLPELIVVDNAPEFYSMDLEDACAQLGISIHYAPLKKSWYRNSIERYFRTINQGLIHQLPGTTFSNIFDKKDYDPEKNAVISFASFLKLLHVWIVDDYHQRAQRGIKDLPARKWLNSISDWEPNLPPNNKDLRTLLGFVEYRKVTSSGIEIFGLHYNCPELSLIRRFSGSGQDELIKYDPDDISYVYCYNRRDDEFIIVPALDQDYTKGLTLWQHNAIKKYNRNVVKNEVNVEGLRQTKETMRNIISEDISALKTITQRQKLMRFLNVGQPDYTPKDNVRNQKTSTSESIEKSDVAKANKSFGGVSNIGLDFDEISVNEDSFNSTADLKIVQPPAKKKRKYSKAKKENNTSKSEKTDVNFEDVSGEDSFEEINSIEELNDDDNWSVGYDLPVD